MEMQIRRRIEEVVHPEPTRRHPAALLHELSKVDELIPRELEVTVLLFFKNGGFAEETVQALKSALSEVLAIFYPMAGKLVQRAGGRVAVSCVEQGVPFTEAWADGPLSLFGPDFQPQPAFALLIPSSSSSSSPLESLLRIQVTHFTCGGFCLCIQEHHILGDAASIFHFMQSWVDVLNGKRELSLYPYMDSSILRDGYKLNNLLPPSSQYAQNLLAIATTHMPPQNDAPFISKIFHFTPSFIEALKEDAKLSHCPTSYECIAAYLWQNVTKARQLSPDQNTRLVYPVDIRKRLDPPLPLGYFGNAIFTAFANAKVEDLVAKPLSYAMSRIREATSIMTSDYMKLALDWLEGQHLPLSFSIVSPNNLFANSWSHFQFCDLNFPWGKPCCFRKVPPKFFGEQVLILPSTLGKGHMDVLVTLKSEHMLKFQYLIV